MYLNPNVNLVLLESSCWVKFNEFSFIIFIFKLWKILNFEWILLLKIQTNYKKLGLEGKMSWMCSHLGPTTHVTLLMSMHQVGLECLELWCEIYWLLNHFFIDFFLKPRLKTISEYGSIMVLLESPHQVWFNNIDSVILKLKMWTILLKY